MGSRAGEAGEGGVGGERVGAKSRAGRHPTPVENLLYQGMGWSLVERQVGVGRGP